MDQPKTDKSVALIPLIIAILGLVILWKPRSENPEFMGYAIYASILFAAAPLLLTAVWIPMTEGLGRTLAWAGVGAGILGWVLFGAPMSGGYVIGEMFFEHIDTIFTAGTVLLGLGLALSLAGVALGAEGLTRTLAFVGAGLAVGAPLIHALGDLDGRVGQLVISLPMIAGALPGIPALSGKGELPSKANAEALTWAQALEGAQLFGKTVVAFVLMGIILGRVANTMDDRDVLAALTGLESLVSLGLLVVAAVGLAKLARCPDVGARALARVASVGAGAAAATVVAGLMLTAASVAHVVESIAGPGETLGVFSTLQTAGWLVAVLGLLGALARIAKIHDQGSLAIGAGITALVFCAGSFMLAALELNVFDEPSPTTLIAATVLALGGVIAVLVVIGRFAKLNLSQANP